MCVRHGHLQQRLDDVADGAVVRETDLLCCGDEVTKAEQKKHTTTLKFVMHEGPNTQSCL